MNNKRIIFMGSPDFAAVILEKLYKKGFNIIEVISNPDKAKGRKKELVPCDVRAKAMELNIPTYTTSRVRNEADVDYIKGLKPDMIIVAAFGQIIPKVLLDLPEYGCVNVHASLLPAYRGAAPIQWSILNGENVTGITIMKMGEGLDTGDIITQREVKIASDETAGTLFDKMAETGAELLIDTIPSIFDGTAKYIEQPEESTTDYAKIISKEMGRIDWNKDSKEIERLVRGMNPWPCAYTSLDGKTVKIWKACLSEEVMEGSLGSVKADKKHIYVLTGKGTLEICELQLEGKKRMIAGDFLRGKNIDGEIFA